MSGRKEGLEAGARDQMWYEHPMIVVVHMAEGGSRVLDSTKVNSLVKKTTSARKKELVVCTYMAVPEVIAIDCASEVGGAKRKTSEADDLEDMAP